MSALFSVSDVFAIAKVMLFASLIMMLLAKARGDVMLAHYAVRRNIIHAVNITDEVNITCPQGQTSFSVNAPLRASRYSLSRFSFILLYKLLCSWGEAEG